MRLHRVLCPKCGTSLNSKAGVAEGQALKCPKCHVPFKAEAPVEAVEEVEDEPEPPRTKKPAARGESASRKPAKRRPVENDDEDEEEEDDRPRRKRRKPEEEKGGYQKLKENIWVRVITLAVLLTIMGILGWKLYEKNKADNEAREFNREVERRQR